MCATSIGSTFSHSPVPGERKSGIPDGTEIPGAGQDDGALGAAQQLRQPLGRGGGQPAAPTLTSP